MMRNSIYLTELLNFLNMPLLGNLPTDYIAGIVIPIRYLMTEITVQRVVLD